jgi:cardiolipin synthase
MDFPDLRPYTGRALRWVGAGALLVVATIGLLFIFLGAAVQRVRGVGAEETPLAPAEPAFRLSITLLTGTPLVPGNRVQLALNGDGTFPHQWTDLRSARRSITFQMYYLAPGRVADTLAAILAE